MGTPGAVPDQMASNKTKILFQGGKIPPGDFTEEFFRKDFITTWIEWAAQRFEQIFVGGSQTGTGGTIIYTVPANSTFYWVGWEADSANGNIEFGVSTGTPRIVSNTVGIHDYTIPFKLAAGTTILVGTVGAGNTARLKIWGFLVPATL